VLNFGINNSHLVAFRHEHADLEAEGAAVGGGCDTRILA